MAAALCGQPVPADAVRLFQPAASPPARALSLETPEQEARILREAWLDADPAALRTLFRSALPSAPRGATAGASTPRDPQLPPIHLQLFPDTGFVLSPRRVLDREALPGAGIRAGRGRTIHGVLIAGGEGTAVLSEFEGAISATIRVSSGEFYELEARPGQPAEVRQVEDPGRFPGNDMVLPPDEDWASGSGTKVSPSLLEDARARFAEGERVLTVAAFYTPRVLQARGGQAGLFAFLRRIEEESNEALRNSGLDLEFRFVSLHLAEHDDTQQNMSYNGALSYLRSVYEPAAAPRSRLSTLFVDPPLSSSGRFTVGIAYLRIPSVPPQRHSVVHHRYAGSQSLSFAHEAGHNFGCVHDVANGGASGGLYGDSRGYQHTSGTPRFYDVMAYSCSGCRAIPYFSEPNVLYEGVPVGTAAARCAATIEREARDTFWMEPPPAGCAIEMQPSALTVSGRAQEIHAYVHTENGCAWDVLPAEGQDPARFEDLDAGIPRNGPGWLRLRIPENPGITQNMIRVLVRGQRLTVTQHAGNGPWMQADPPRISFRASTQPDTVQERCVFVESSSQGAVMKVQTEGLPAWLSMDREDGVLPGFLCARADAAGLPAGSYRAAALLSLEGPPTLHTQLLVELEVDASAEPVYLSPRAFSFNTSHSQPITASQRLEVFGPPGLRLEPLSSPTPWLIAEEEAGPEGLGAWLRADASGLAAGVYHARLLVTCAEGDCADRVIPVRLEVTGETPAEGPRIHSGGVVNAASFQPGLSPGSWMSLFGERLAPAAREWTVGDFDGPRLPVALDGVRVYVDGMEAAVSFISPGQINFQCPDLEREGWVWVEVVTPSGRHRVEAFAEARNPGFFLFGSSGAVAALHQDATPAAAADSLPGGVFSRAAQPGEILSFYATGFGATSPEVPSGILFQGAAPLPASLPVTVTVGGVPADLLFTGLSAAGLNQVNLRVPDLPPGEHPVWLLIGSTPAARVATLSVE